MNRQSLFSLDLTPFLAHLFFKMETWTYFEDLEAEVFEARALVAAEPSNWLTSLCARVFLLSTQASDLWIALSKTETDFFSLPPAIPKNFVLRNVITQVLPKDKISDDSTEGHPNLIL